MDVSQIAQQIHLLADETRLRILLVLVEGAATVSDLSTQLELPQPRVSTHLALLRDAGLVGVETAGRQRTYHVDAVRIKSLLDALQTFTPAQEQRPEISAQAARQVRHNTPLRQSRTCYDHLAGSAGVQLLDALLEREWLLVEDANRPTYRLTEAGTQALKERGVDVEQAKSARRQFAFGCLDWTERRTHLGGSLGAAVFEALRVAGVVQQVAEDRHVILVKPLDEWLGSDGVMGC
ncbi:MAG: ArsR family transcriptional regulator [Chloroflexi bacterium AL-W]|nr:ArsR family transcriptional regulator [Chloroflexi bacterium AL-N1]NOK67038.1 ArsR family transcriptional regulator [Chloroflexi bacterium AL-N10]NOK74670.1 ArsR family transcriptional regulator [Chloroflexi bacterium AL-N5]NOK81640.1 ArsR family transcriptional regulator [Chloroflexi bacterium AL-W]NOK89110.1 ArsR family transcriptional regulator [Chloroflexi bacterium AL-N15]